MVTYVYIDKELARASKRAIEMLGQKDIYHVFTPLFPNTSTRIILKKPKTDSSIRKVWLPKTLAYILREWKSAQDELRALLRDEYQTMIWWWRCPTDAPVRTVSS